MKATEKKRILLRGLHVTFAVTAGVIFVTEKKLQDDIVLLVIEEAKGVVVDGYSALKTEQPFLVRK